MIEKNNTALIAWRRLNDIQLNSKVILRAQISNRSIGVFKVYNLNQFFNSA